MPRAVQLNRGRGPDPLPARGAGERVRPRSALVGGGGAEAVPAVGAPAGRVLESVRGPIE